MNLDNRRYLLGSIVTINSYDVGQISSMNSEEVEVLLPNKKTERVFWHQVRPIWLSSEYMQKIGFNLVKKMNHPHHIEYIMDIRINGKFYTARGIVLKERSIWSFNSVSIKYIHQVQSLIWIIEPNFNFKIDKIN